MHTHSPASLEGLPEISDSPCANGLNRGRSAATEDAEDDQHGDVGADCAQDAEDDEQAEGDDVYCPPTKCLGEG